MVTPYHFVVLQVPTFHTLVFSTWIQVSMSIAHQHFPHCIDMSSQWHFQLPSRQFPELNAPVIPSRNQPLVSHIHIYTPHPTLMTTYHSFQFPWSLPFWLHQTLYLFLHYLSYSTTVLQFVTFFLSIINLKFSLFLFLSFFLPSLYYVHYLSFLLLVFFLLNLF
jgi:hypothetical protein